MGWGMLWLFFALKIPLLTLCWLVWWAIKQTPESDEQGTGDGGQRRRPHPPPRLPHAPRRGPHGDEAQLPSPPRVRRPVKARARTTTTR